MWRYNGRVDPNIGPEPVSRDWGRVGIGFVATFALIGAGAWAVWMAETLI